jgi:hypothetical protein
VYTSEWLPCEFCRSRNITKLCIKIQGPVAEATRQFPRLQPSNVDVNIPAEDALLLDYAYSRFGNSRSLRAFYRLLHVVYGPGIPDADLLRHAVLGWCARCLKPEDFRNKAEDHQRQAISGMRHALDRPKEIRDTDIFAAWILLETAWTCGMWDEASTHAKGCMSMLGNVYSGEPPSLMLTVFRPLIFDRVNLWGTVCFIQDRATHFSSFFPQKLTSFKDRVAYEWELQRSAVSIRSLQQFSLAYAIQKTLGNLLTILTFCWQEKLRREQMGGDPIFPVIDRVMSYVHAELGDPDLTKALFELQQTCTPKFKGESIESQMDSFQLVQLKSIHLMMAILLTSSEDAHGISEIAQEAETLLAFYRREITGEERLIENVIGSYTQSIILAGWVLSTNAVIERKLFP